MDQPGSDSDAQPAGASPPSPRTYGCMTAFGLVLALLGGMMMLGDSALETGGLRTQGTVTGFDGAGNSAQAMVTFTDRQGESRTFRAGSNSDLGLAAGEQVPVIYDPDDPTTATVDSFVARSLLPWSFLGFGVLVALLGLASIAKLRRAGR